MRSYLQFLLMVCAALTPPSLAHAQDCGLYYSCGVGNHEAPYIPADGVVNNPHWECAWCLDCHQQCRISDDPLASAAYAASMKAATGGTIAEIVQLAHLTNGRIGYNQARRAIQILTCSGGHVVATVTVKEQDIALAIQLPRIDDLRALATLTVSEGQNRPVFR